MGPNDGFEVESIGRIFSPNALLFGVSMPRFTGNWMCLWRMETAAILQNRGLVAVAAGAGAIGSWCPVGIAATDLQ